MKATLGSVEVSVRLPQVGPARLITTLSLASGFSALWIGAPAYLPYASVDPTMVLAGIGVPLGVGYVGLLLAEWRIRKELQRASRLAKAGELDPLARVGEVLVGAAQRERDQMVMTFEEWEAQQRADEEWEAQQRADHDTPGRWLR